jgi:hypothetical protein
VDSVKKPTDPNVSPQIAAQLGGYGVYPFYTPPFFHSDHQNPKPPPVAQSAHMTPANAIEYSKNKEPPLDLMNKPSQQQQQQHQQQQQGPPSQQPQSITDLAMSGKEMGNQSQQQQQQQPPPQHQLPPASQLGASQNPPPQMPRYFSYPHYIPSGYPYNLDPSSYGAVSMITDENKMGSSGPPQPGSIQIKEERNKESPSPHEHSKQGGQQVGLCLFFC